MAVRATADPRLTRAGAYRAYAEELRAIAAWMPPGRSRSYLLTTADDFDSMARAADDASNSKMALSRMRGDGSR